MCQRRRVIAAETLLRNATLLRAVMVWKGAGALLGHIHPGSAPPPFIDNRSAVARGW